MTTATSNVDIRAARLITGRGHEVIEDAAVRVENGRIVAAGAVGSVPAPADESVPVVAFPEGTVLPGLIDPHVHLTFRRGETSVEHTQRVSDEQALLRGVQAARQVLAAGVTTVRDCGSRKRIMQELRDGVRERLIAGPRMLVSGPPITTTSGHLWSVGYEADSANEGRQAVRRLVKEGVDFVKVMATGGGMTPGSVTGRAQYSTDELRAIVEDAHRLGRHVAAHAHGTEGLARAAEAGVDTIEHCSWLDEHSRRGAFDERVARLIGERGIFANVASSPPRYLVEGNQHGSEAGLNPTQGAAPWLDRWEHALRARARGVLVCFSTDAVYGWWDDGHDLSYLAQVLIDAVGLKPLEVIEMATAIAARAIGLGDRLGTIEEGKLADLLVVEGDPSTDVRALHSVAAVYQEGVRAV